MTRNKLLLRSLLFTANRTMMSKFPTTIVTNVKIKAVHNAMPSAVEGTRKRYTYLMLKSNELFYICKPQFIDESRGKKIGCFSNLYPFRNN